MWTKWMQWHLYHTIMCVCGGHIQFQIGCSLNNVLLLCSLSVGCIGIRLRQKRIGEETGMWFGIHSCNAQKLVNKSDVTIPGIFLGNLGSQCTGLTTLTPSCAYCLEIWKPQPPGMLWAWIRLYGDCLTFCTHSVAIRWWSGLWD